MALEKVGALDRLTITAAVDLTGDQYHFVTLAGHVCGAGALGFVLMDNPAQGDTGTICRDGAPKVTAGGTVSTGDFLASNASGQAVVAAASDVILGIALENAVSGDVFQIASSPSGATVAAA